MPRSYSYYSTWMELEFLAYLGTGKWTTGSCDMDRRRKLIGYRNAALKRTDWAGIDKQAIFDYLNRQLAT